MRGGGALARGRQAREHGYTPSRGFQIASWRLIPKKGCWKQGTVLLPLWLVISAPCPIGLGLGDSELPTVVLSDIQ